MRTILILVILLSMSIVCAQENPADEIEQGRLLVENNAECGSLTDEQLESIGEYVMEQMHPGESHNFVHERMGLEEGTKEHETFHINFARRFYCGENVAGMMGFAGQNLRGGNMMDFGTGYGMMGTLFFGTGLLWLVYVALAGFIVSVIFWSVYRWIVDAKKNGRKR